MNYSVMNSILKYIDLHQGEEDKNKVLENVKNAISFRGSNLWVLACAIVVASVGLNVNSTAVIIGAMLISPLMGPIVGAGFSLGIYDFFLLRKSIKNLVISTIVSLFVATIYFYLSPLKETQSELLARTSPNFYDIIIAFFGGLVGVIAITRVEKGNPIPGVAIATALMPPLCTAGYGLAIWDLSFFLGAMYLYVINCVFICIATFIIVKYLKFPSVEKIGERYEKQIRIFIYTLIFLLVMPSIYLAYNLLSEKKFNQKANDFINQEFTSKGITVINKRLKFNTKEIELILWNKKISNSEILNLNDKLNLYGIPNVNLKIQQDTTDIKEIILNELKGTKKTTEEFNLKLAAIENSDFDNTSLYKETKILFPEIQNISIENHHFNASLDSINKIPVVIYRTSSQISEQEQEKLKEWLINRYNKKNILIFSY